MRVPFCSQLAYHWDSIQFALGIGDFDIAASQPHAPGYFLYVMLGRLVNCWLGDPHASLVWVSVVAGAALPAVGYLLGASWFGRACGLATGAILATSPLCWFHSEVALTTILDATLTTTAMLAGWLAIRSGGSWPSVAGMALMLALVAANRQQTAAILLPVWLYAFSRFQPPRWTKFLGGAALAAVFCCLWLVPMTQMTGGLGVYLECLAAKKRMGTPYSALAGGLQPLLFNIKQIALACWTGLLAAAIVGCVELVRWAVFSPRASKILFVNDHREPLRLLALWLAPQIAFGLLIYTLMPGHVLSYFPALATLAALALCRAAQAFGGWAAQLALVSAMAALNAVVFMTEPRWSAVLPLTAPRLEAQQRELTECFKTIRSRYQPDRVAICHRGQFFYWGFRHFMYYLPEYRNVLLTTDESLPGARARQQWVAQSKRTVFMDRAEFPPGTTLLLVVPPGETLKLFDPVFSVQGARLVAGTAGTVYELAGCP